MNIIIEPIISNNKEQTSSQKSSAQVPRNRKAPLFSYYPIILRLYSVYSPQTTHSRRFSRRNSPQSRGIAHFDSIPPRSPVKRVQIRINFKAREERKRADVQADRVAPFEKRAQRRAELLLIKTAPRLSVLYLAANR